MTNNPDGLFDARARLAYYLRMHEAEVEIDEPGWSEISSTDELACWLLDRLCFQDGMTPGFQITENMVNAAEMALLDSQFADCDLDVTAREAILQVLGVAQRCVESRETTTPPASTSTANAAGEELRFYALPFAFHEPADDNGAAYVRDANGQAVATMMWPGHSMEDTDAAVSETYALGRAFAAAVPKAAGTAIAAGESINPMVDPEVNWLVHQLEAWPTRVDPDRTINIQWLMQKAAWVIRGRPLAAAPKAASEDGATGREQFAENAKSLVEIDPATFERAKAHVAAMTIVNADPITALAALAASPTDATGAEMRERCAKACEDQAASFLSPEYATGQPLSSFQERFACQQCADAIRNLPVAGETL